MFSHIVTAAKGLFTRSDSQSDSADPAGTSDTTTSKMVTSTRRAAAASKSAIEARGAESTTKKGKRKAPSDEQQTKRRKRNSLDAAESDDEEDESSKTPAVANEKKSHFRFGSEEPAAPEFQPEAIPQVSNNDEEDDSDSDDDAPETIDNSAQLMKIKEQAKKQEKLKQIEEQMKKEKRRKLDERRKLQAKSRPKETTSSDDLLSESTATLQGSNTQDVRRSALPALLPDDILNAEPVLRPPTPPAEDAFMPKKSNKLRFLEKSEKAPKDVQAGDVTIRVLDAPSSKKSKSNPTLAPKASKAGRNVKENWLKRQRSTGSVNGLRRTAGGSSGFVRR
ncbi:hypothetical protein N7488_010521 [Penicillium malachiteum]|nr:hypothetical protein N7488_010521 [Penicillium malachiteum]